MIVPINSGRAITPIYIPDSTTNSQQTIQQTEQQTNNSEPIDWSNPGAWVIILIALAGVIFVAVVFADLLKEIEGGEE